MSWDTLPSDPTERAELEVLMGQVWALEKIPAGPALATALAAIDEDRVLGLGLPYVLQARFRQANHERGELLAAVDRILRHGVVGAQIRKRPDEFAADEVRAALRLTRRAAKHLCELAWDLHRRLPSVLNAMRDGVLDQPRGKVFSTWTQGLTREHTDAVVAELLPTAHELTTGELAAEIARMAIALDPEWVRRRYEAALRNRRMVGKKNPDGTGTLAGHDLPADEVLTACAHLDALARAAKAAGHLDRVDHLRADLLVGLLTGRYSAMTDQQIIQALLAEAKNRPPAPATDLADYGLADDNPADDNPADNPADDNPADGPAADEPAATDDAATGAPADTSATNDPATHDDPADDEPTDDDAGTGASAGTSATNDPATNDDPDDDEPAADDAGTGASDGARADEAATDDEPHGDDPATETDASAGEDPADDDPADDDSAVAAAADDRATDDESATHAAATDEDPADGDGDALVGRSNIGRRGGLRLSASLLTIVGGDQRPADLLGWGPVHAELACDLARKLRSWWCVLTEDGAPQAVVPIRRRPTPPDAAQPRRHGEVWLHVDRDMLGFLQDMDRLGLYGPGWSKVLGEIIAKLDTATTGPPNGDPTARLPGAALRRWIHIRDGRCTFPGCRAPAHRADADHTTEHSNGGATTDTGLAAACRHDHRLRHDGGWTVEHTQPGQVSWTSRLGHTYRRHNPTGLLDLPPPRPDAIDDRDPEPPPADPPPWADPDSCFQTQPEPPPPPAPILSGRPATADDEIPPY